MNIKNRIAKHRAEIGLTQEKFAELLGVSTAAVSKWECGKAYPDIELLPVIAGIFNVSIDYLLGHDCSKNNTLSEIIKEANEFAKQGKRDDSIALLERTLLRYPADDRLIFEIARHKFIRARFWTDKKRKAELNDLIDSFLTVAKRTSDLKCRALCYNYLTALCVAMSDFESAEKYNAELLSASKLHPEINQTAIALQKSIDETSLQILTKNIAEALNEYSSLISWKLHADFTRKDYARVIDDSKRAVEILSAHNDECGGRFFYDIASFYEAMALAYAESKEYNMVLNCLECAAENAIRYDSSDIKESCAYDFFDDISLEEEKVSSVKSMLNALTSDERSAYAPINDTERYKAIIQKLTSLS